MKLFFAGNVVTSGSDQIMFQSGCRNRLLSYAFIEDWAQEQFDFWIYKHQPGMCVFLDSGAFSAHTRGITINIDKYCDFIARHQDRLHCFVALDVIGSWRRSHQNLQYMRDRGLHPMPVFHSGEPYEVLGEMLSVERHIALGGMASDNPTREKLRQYLDKCFKVIGKFWPVRVHGFGIMAQWALERYPFYSVDSSSAIVSAGMGQVATFERGVVGGASWREYARRTLDGGIMDHVADDRAKKGSAHMGRRAQNIKVQLQLEAHVTKLWASRGIVW